MVIDRFEGPYFFLSNFYPSEVRHEADVYPTVEHAFQAAKTLDPSERAWVRDAQSPALAKRLGRKVALRSDWERIKVDIMRQLLLQKFESPELGLALRETAGHELIEGNTWNDRFWGVCRGRGQNHLGRLLMEIRARLAGES